MDAVTYPDVKVEKLLNDDIVAVKIQPADDAALAKRFNVSWTPTFVLVDGEEREHFRAFGWLPAEDFKAQTEFAIGLAHVNRGEFAQAKERFDHVTQHHPKTLAAADALYWYGVADYKATGQKETLLAKWNTIIDQHPNHPWATKVSFIRAGK